MFPLIFTAIHPRDRSFSSAADFKAGASVSSVFSFKQWTRSSLHLRYRINKEIRKESRAGTASWYQEHFNLHPFSLFSLLLVDWPPRPVSVIVSLPQTPFRTIAGIRKKKNMCPNVAKKKKKDSSRFSFPHSQSSPAAKAHSKPRQPRRWAFSCWCRSGRWVSVRGSWCSSRKSPTWWHPQQAWSNAL